MCFSNGLLPTRANRTNGWAGKGSGFTFIELAMVIVLLGVMSVSARALFVSQDSFSGAVVRNQLLSSARLTQQAALAKNDGTAVTFNLTQVGDNIEFRVSHGIDLSERQVELAGSTVTWSTANLSGSCALVTGSLPHSMTFDADGETTKTLFCITGSKTHKVCVGALGFAYEGDCDS